jgi:hypothetical protein
MRWPWQRRRRTGRWMPPDRIPDGDTVLARGQRRWSDLLVEPDLAQDSSHSEVQL